MRGHETPVVVMDADLAFRLAEVMSDRSRMMADGPVARDTLEEWLEEVATVVSEWGLERLLREGGEWRSAAVWTEVADSLELRAAVARATAERAKKTRTNNRAG